MTGGGLECGAESLVPFLCVEIILDLETIVLGLALQNWSTGHAVIHNTGCATFSLWEGWDTYEWIKKLKWNTSICTCQQCSLCRCHGHIKRLSIHCQWTNDSQGDRNISNHILTVSSLEKSSRIVPWFSKVSKGGNTWTLAKNSPEFQLFNGMSFNSLSWFDKRASLLIWAAFWVLFSTLSSL